MKIIKKLCLAFLLCSSALFFTQCQKEAANQNKELTQKEVANKNKEINQNANLSLNKSRTFEAQRTIQQVYPFGASIFNCVEYVNVEGVVHLVLIPENITSPGRFSRGYHIEAQGTGVGSNSGAKYLWRDNWTEKLEFDIITTSNAGHYTFRHNLRLIGTADAPSFNVTEVVSITVNANGEVLVYSYSFESTC